MRKDSGYTLLELALAMSVSGVLAAGGLSLLAAGKKLQATQDALLTTQHSLTTGVDMLIGSIKKAGEHEYLRRRTPKLEGAGIITSAANYGYGLTIPNIAISQSATGPTYNSVKSDQLVVKYFPKNTKELDCEGRAITSTTVEVVERWFVRQSDYGNDLSLACDSGRFNGTTVTDIGDAGVEVIPNVDQFSIRLNNIYLRPSTTINLTSAVRSAAKYSEVTINKYKTYAEPYVIMSVDIGLVVHSSRPHSSQVPKYYEPTGGWAPMLFGTDVRPNASGQADADQYVHSAVFRTVVLFNPFS